ncbi:hypothetical protein [Snuella lapsa]|uniref:Uncharacterized protein n=1 Tax=Snuella lapsa TaxID=870481 RepID=A0ABP6XBZ1_9FLAO
MAVYNLKTKELFKIPNVKSYSFPEKWSGQLAYYLEEIKTDKKETKSDSTKIKEKNITNLFDTAHSEQSEESQK